jgi:phage minor structural protein
MITLFDPNKKPLEFEKYLCKPNGTTIASLNNTTNPIVSYRLKDVDKLVFKAFFKVPKNHKQIDDPTIPLLKSGYLIKVRYNETTQYFKIKNLVKSSDENGDFLEVTAFSLEIELNQKKLRNLSLTSVTCTEVLNYVLSSTNWNVAHVDSSFDQIFRDFEVSNKSVMDFLYNDVCDQYSAIAVFDSVNKNVSLYAEDTYGEDKGLRISYGHYMKSVEEDLNEDDLTTKLYCFGSGNTSIETVNPNGSQYLLNFDHFLLPYEEDVDGSVITSSTYMSDSLAGAIVSYNALVDSKSPTSQNAGAGTTTTQIVLPSHGLNSGEFVTNRSRGRETRKILSVPNTDTVVVESIVGMSETDLIEKYNSSTFGYLLFGRDDINASISTKTDELNALKLEKAQILDRLAVQSAAKTMDSFVGALTNGDMTRTLSGVNTGDRYAAMVRVSTETGTAVSFDGSIKTFTANEWSFLGKTTAKTNYSLIVSTVESDVSVQTLIVKITEDEYTSATDAELIDKYSADNKQIEIDAKQIEIDSLNSDLADKNAEISTMSTSLSLEGNLTSTQLDEIQNFIYEDTYTADSLVDPYDIYDSGVEEITRRNSPQILYKTGIIDFESSIRDQKSWGKLNLGDRSSIVNSNVNINVKVTILEIERDFETCDINLTIGNSKKILSKADKLLIAMYKSIHTTKKVDTSIFKWNSTNLNFSNRNDRISVKPSNVTIPSDGTSIDHVQNDNGSVDISFEWLFDTYDPASPVEANNIDGFFVYYYSSDNDNNITFGSTSTRKPVERVPYTERSFAVYGVAANKYYTFGVQAYRIVDEDIDPSGMLTSDIIQPSLVTENPYRPMDNVALKGDLSGSIDNVPTSDIISQLNDLASDGKISPNEKIIINKDWALIQAEKPILDDSADVFSITTEKTAYGTAYSALDTYIAPLLASLTTTSDIDASTFAAKFSDYFDAKATLEKAISDANKTLADNAKDAADDAQVDATSALNKLTDIASDSKLTPVEKQQTLNQWNVIASEKSTIDSQATTYSITTTKTTYDMNFQALADYLNGGTTWSSGTPSMLSDLTTTTTIVGSTFRSNFKDYYDAKIAVLNAITDTVKALADGKVTTYYQDSEPTGSEGDLWLDTNDGNKLYRYDGSDWVAVQDTAIQTALDNAQNALDTADGKIVSFYQTTAPGSASEGDLWIDTDDKNKLYRYTSGSWVAARDTDIATAITNAATAQSAAATAQSKADSSVQKDTLYNKIKISETNGIEVLDASSNQRVQIADLGSSKYGIRIKNSSGTTTVETNSSGELELTGGKITIVNSDGSQVILDATNGLTRKVKGQKVATYYLPFKSTEDSGYSGSSQIYAVARLRGDAWYNIATQYNTVLADTGKTAGVRQNILESMVVAGLLPIFSDISSSSPAYGLSFDWLTNQIGTSGIYVKEVKSVNIGDSIVIGTHQHDTGETDGDGDPIFETVNDTETSTFKGAVMTAFGSLTPTSTPISFLMDILGTLDVDMT